MEKDIKSLRQLELFRRFNNAYERKERVISVYLDEFDQYEDNMIKSSKSQIKNCGGRL